MDQKRSRGWGIFMWPVRAGRVIGPSRKVMVCEAESTCCSILMPLATAWCISCMKPPWLCCMCSMSWGCAAGWSCCAALAAKGRESRSATIIGKEETRDWEEILMLWHLDAQARVLLVLL